MRHAKLHVFSTREGYGYTFAAGNWQRTGTLPYSQALTESAIAWQEIKTALSSRVSAAKKASGNKLETDRETLEKLIVECDRWLSDTDLKIHERELKDKGINHLHLQIDPKGILPHLPLEYTRWGTYHLSYCPRSFPSFTPPEPASKTVAVLAGDGQLNLDRDRAAIEGKFKNPEILENPDARVIAQSLEDAETFFYCGHSANGKLAIGKNEIAIEDLKPTFKRAKGLKLALFNSCDGLGLILLEHFPIPATIIWAREVPDEAAADFLSYLLEELSDNPFQAFETARDRLAKKWEEKFPGVLSAVQFWGRFSDAPPPRRKQWTWRQKAIAGSSAIAAAAVVLTGGYFLGRDAIARHYIRAGFEPANLRDFEKAKASFRRATFFDRKGGAFYNLGLVAEYEGEISKAKEYFRKAVRRGYPDAFATLPLLIAQTSESKEELVEADWLIEQCLAQSGDLPRSRDGAWISCLVTEGIILQNNGFYWKAEENFERAIAEALENRKENPKAAYPTLALCYLIVNEMHLENSEKIEELKAKIEEWKTYQKISTPANDRCFNKLAKIDF